MSHLVLASASPRRADLLRAAGFSFDVLAVDVDERRRPSEPPADYVRRLASEKSAAALARLRTGAASVTAARTEDVADIVLLAADTAVVVDGEVFGKPADARDAAAMLTTLSGRSHDVVTGVSVRRGDVELVRVERTVVEFAVLTSQDVAWYVSQSEWRDKAGGYGIQGLASRFIPAISGSYSNVVGLPVAVVQAMLVEIASVDCSGYPVA